VRTVYVIGIGAGDPEHVTVQAIKALNEVDVFFVLDKGDAKSELVELREEILRRYVTRPAYRVVHGQDPDRDRTNERYGAAVQNWRRRRADVYERLLDAELVDGQVGAFLVWGDPALYDSTIGIIEDVAGRAGMALDWRVVPGISSVSALAARHRVSLNQVAGAVQITTGRRLAAGLPDGVDDVVVMLDAHGAFAALTEPDLEIFWGAYVGTPEEILVAGPVTQVSGQILAARARARERKGWIMDSYLLRRRSPGDGLGT
jgi:precorrin-6A synthase